MKQVFFRLAWLAARIAAILSACIGCTPNKKPEPAEPHVTRWQGQETGYAGTSTGPRSNSAPGAGATP